MKEPIIVDTSVWIDFFRGRNTDQVKVLTEYIENDYPIYLCPTIIQEILQGIVNDNEFLTIKEYIMAFNILNDDAIQLAVSAAALYRMLRKKGITIRKSNDCLIAQYAINYTLNILHTDRDFDMIIEHK